jgi:hypothetical protein
MPIESVSWTIKDYYEYFESLYLSNDPGLSGPDKSGLRIALSEGPSAH